MAIVKVSWSGGKDSTCACFMRLASGDAVKAVCYIPMFTDNIPLITKKHYDFILTTKQKLELAGASVHLAHGITYWDYVTHVARRGKNKGKIFGFPLFVKSLCGFKRDSKLKALASCDVGYYDFEDIGIAFDENDRFAQLNETKRSILVDLQITESMAYDFCSFYDVLSPIYITDGLRRDGCSLCPHGSAREREIRFSDYPEAIPLVLELQDMVKVQRPEQTPLRNHSWFI